MFSDPNSSKQSAVTEHISAAFYCLPIAAFALILFLKDDYTLLQLVPYSPVVLQVVICSFLVQ